MFIKGVVQKELRYNRNENENPRNLVHFIAGHLHRAKTIQLCLKHIQQYNYEELGKMRAQINNPVNDNHFGYSILDVIPFVLFAAFNQPFSILAVLTIVFKQNQIHNQNQHQEKEIIQEIIRYLDYIEYSALYPIFKAVLFCSDLVREVQSAKREIAVVDFVLEELENAHQTPEHEQADYVNADSNVVESFVEPMSFITNQNKSAKRNAQIGQIAAHFDQVTKELNEHDLERLARVRN